MFSTLHVRGQRACVLTKARSKEAYSLPGLPLFNIMLGALFGLPVGLAAAALVRAVMYMTLSPGPALTLCQARSVGSSVCYMGAYTLGQSPVAYLFPERLAKLQQKVHLMLPM